MKNFVSSIRLVLLISTLCYFATSVTSQGTELTPWSQWACFNGTVASRARILQNCSDMEYIDSVTNMTATNRSCDNTTETDRRTDVVSANTWSNWAPMITCSAAGMVTQSRTSSCQRASLECSNNCTGGRTTQRTTTVPLCCAQQMYSDWTSWTPPGCSPSAPIQQTRRRQHIPCDPSVQCEPNCSDIIETRIVAQTAWGPWGPWSSMQVPMCGDGQRSRQRVCTNTSLIHCVIDCTLGSTDIDNQCCMVPNIWSTWSTWSQTTNSGPCPDTRTRTRSCVSDPSVMGVNATRPACVGTCSLNFTESEPQQVDTPRCAVNGTTVTTPIIVCSSTPSTNQPSGSDSSNDDNNSNDHVIIAVFATLFVIAAATNVLLIVVIVFMVKKLRKASYSPNIPGHLLYETVDKPKSFTKLPADYESSVEDHTVDAGPVQIQDNPSYNVISHDGLYM